MNIRIGRLVIGLPVRMSVFRPGLSRHTRLCVRVTRHVFPLPVILAGAIPDIAATGNGQVVVGIQAVMPMNGNYRAEQTFPVTENYVDAGLMIGRTQKYRM